MSHVVSGLDKKLLQSFLETPTSPFREEAVTRLVLERAGKSGVRHFVDPHGNIVLGVSSESEYLAKVRSSAAPVRVFIAHMDHPGFHGVKWGPKGNLEAEWHGGAPVKHLVGAPVWASVDGREVVKGVIKKVKIHSKRPTIEKLTIGFKASAGLSGNDATHVFGGFDFGKFYWRKGSRIYTKAADDLVGSFVVYSLAEMFKDAEVPFIGLLTRGEEVGFIGAISHFSLGWLTGGNVMCVSLETSRMLPGAQSGLGPVVRLGDRATVFSAGETEALRQLAIKALGKKFQRRIMDGGTCEGTVGTVFGFPTVGISIPLGNYHNQSFEGGPKSRGKGGPAPEFVDEKDVTGMLKLCGALVDASEWPQDPWHLKRVDFRELLQKYQPLMEKFSIQGQKAD